MAPAATPTANQIHRGLFCRPAPRGLVMKNPGGALGWIGRRIIPKASFRTYLAFIRVSRAPSIKRRLRDYREKPNTLFTHMEIETINRCNGECAFCPVNRRLDPRPRRLMPEKLFNRLIDELSALDYQGHLGLFSNNEPLLDRRLPYLAARARNALPHAFLCLSTNGKLLDVELLQRLLPHFDRIVINNYHDEPRLLTNIRAIHDFCDSCEGGWLLRDKTVEICMRCGDDVLTTRAGQAPNCPPPARPLSLPCALPFYQMIVRPDGGVSLCCNDALGKMTLGETTRDSLADIWFGSRFARVRQKMLHEGRAGVDLCSRCDFVKHDLY